jgi:UDP-glucose 6-dehydrogenase
VLRLYTPGNSSPSNLVGAGERVTVLRLAFKPDTNDVRNPRAIPLIEDLREGAAETVGYDSIATEMMRDWLLDTKYTESASDALLRAAIAPKWVGSRRSLPSLTL